MLISRLTMAASIFLLSSTLHAETFALLPGRLASFSDAAPIAVELGAVKYKDGDYIGGRINYRFNRETFAYGDFGQISEKLTGIEAGGTPSDGNSFGIGLFRSLKKLENGYDIALRGSYHKGNVDVSRRLVNNQNQLISIDVDVSELSMDLILSNSIPLTSNNLNWYAGLGYHRVSTKPKIAVAGTTVPTNSVNENDFAATAGVTLPFSVGQLYGGIEYVQEMAYGLGFRYSF